MTYTTRNEAVAEARTAERRTGDRHYAVRTRAGWIVDTRMPLLGEWYDADGIRHG